MKEKKIGEVFEFEGVKVQAIEANRDKGCRECYFGRYIRCNFYCMSYNRTDKKDVIFKEAKSMKQVIEIEVPDGKKAVWKDGKVVFEDIKSQLPKTWEEYCLNNKIKENEFYTDSFSNIIQAKRIGHSRDNLTDKNLLPSQKEAKAHLALMQLHQLRDCYRQGWIPDWSNSESVKYCIEFADNKYIIFSYYTSSNFLSFPTKELAKKFLTNFRELIEQAGDLI